jgi:hypothetical protein
MQLTYLLDFQIRVVNAFRMGLENADSFEKRSLSSMHSQYSVHTMRAAAALVALSTSRQPGSADDSTLSSPRFFPPSSDDSGNVRV